MPILTTRLALAYRMRHQDVVRALNYLERVRHVGRARDSGKIALDLGIFSHAVDEVLLSFRQRRWQIRDLATVDDALTSRHRSDRAELIERARAGSVILEIPSAPPNVCQTPFRLGLPSHALRGTRPARGTSGGWRRCACTSTSGGLARCTCTRDLRGPDLLLRIAANEKTATTAAVAIVAVITFTGALNRMPIRKLSR